MSALGVGLRRARAQDAPALSVVAAATFLDAFAGVIDGDAIVGHCRDALSPEAFAEALETSTTAAWIAAARAGGAPVGYAMVTAPDLPSVETRAGDLELKRIYVLSRYQGFGVGRALMEAVEAHARDAGAGRMLLGVYSGNETALTFYAAGGFERIGSRRFNVGGRVYDDAVLAKVLFPAGATSQTP